MSFPLLTTLLLLIFFSAPSCSFVHTLSNYFRQTGADVKTLRSGPETIKFLKAETEAGRKPDLVVLSPGPGNPTDFKLDDSMNALRQLKIPAFGVCLGLQGMVEHFGGVLGVLSYPMHGKPSSVAQVGAKSMFADLPSSFEVARYHSLHGLKDKLPSCLEVTALTDDGIVMGVQHKTLPYAAVQFHPESILTSPAHGLQIVENAIKYLKYEDSGDGDTQGGGQDVFGREGEGNPDQDLVITTLMELSKQEIITIAKEFKIASPVKRNKPQLAATIALAMRTREKIQSGVPFLDTLTLKQLNDLKKELHIVGKTGMRTKEHYVKLINDALLGANISDF